VEQTPKEPEVPQQNPKEPETETQTPKEPEVPQENLQEPEISKADRIKAKAKQMLDAMEEESQKRSQDQESEEE
jgi:hypothetical protein